MPRLAAWSLVESRSEDFGGGASASSSACHHGAHLRCSQESGRPEVAAYRSLAMRMKCQVPRRRGACGSALLTATSAILLAGASCSAFAHFGQSVSSGSSSQALRGARALGAETPGIGFQTASQRTSRVTRRVWDTAWMSDPVVSCVGWSVVAFSLLIIRVATAAGEDDTETPTSYLQAPEPSQGSPIVCVGDSLTRGNLSADWVGALRGQLAKGLGQEDPAVVLNAGVNMHCSKNIQERLCEVIACRPSHVTVLVGTNDLKAELSPVEGFLYRYFGKLPEVPTLETYEQTLREIRETLVAAGAQVALVSPPVLGEVLNSKANQRAAQFADAVRRVAEEGGDSCAYLPLFERTAAALPAQGGKDYCGVQFFTLLCTLCIDMHLLRRDLADIQRERNLGVTVDLVHLGPSAASMLADMVADFVRSARVTSELPCLELSAAAPQVELAALAAAV
mmetsp:Transcript_38943/g.97857  ORF Transcript_38943/g.97857 Transcript_38943/m.97857 type:complete len:452 (+) Transcript_38943:80-1435(+)